MLHGGLREIGCLRLDEPGIQPWKLIRVRIGEWPGSAAIPSCVDPARHLGLAFPVRHFLTPDFLGTVVLVLKSHRIRMPMCCRRLLFYGIFRNCQSRQRQGARWAVQVVVAVSPLTP